MNLFRISAFFLCFYLKFFEITGNIFSIPSDCEPIKSTEFFNQDFNKNDLCQCKKMEYTLKGPERFWHQPLVDEDDLTFASILYFRMQNVTAFKIKNETNSPIDHHDFIYNPTCTASILNSRYFLTAAHW